jgi:multidrug efflux pump subunit AcrA (membrane-fusion protein)
MQASIKTGVWILLIAMVGLVLWAVFVPLEAGVPSQGMVAVDGRRQVVQHPRGGVISQVLVREGDSVKQGEVLLKLDDSIELAARSQVMSQLTIVQAQTDALDDQLPGLRDLTKDGFYPRNQLIELERKLKEAKASKIGLSAQLVAADLELQRTVIRSPSDGRVMGVGVNTRGGVVIAGAKLMEIVPEDNQVTIEAQVRPHLIDKVAPGAVAQVRFSALESARTPVVFGRIEWISPDRFQNPEDIKNPEGYYLAKVIVTADELAKAQGLKVIPGMPADVIIKTGERTFFEYLAKPFTDRLANAVKEF